MTKMRPPVAKKVRQYWQTARQFLDEKRRVIADEVQFSRTHNIIHFWVMVYKSFERNRCFVRSGALTFSSLLALIPLLALVISISTGILQSQEPDDFRQNVRELIEHVVSYVAPQLQTLSNANQIEASEPPSTSEGEPATPDSASANTETESPPAEEAEIAEGGKEELVDGIITFVNRVQTASLTASGVVGLIFVALSMLITIESTFNDIWGVSQGKGWISRLMQYWTVLSLGSVFIFVIMGSKFNVVLDFIRGIPQIGPFLGATYEYVFPILIVFIAFTIIYITTPNTKVQIKAAAIGGLVAAVLWKINNLSSGTLLADRIARDQMFYAGFAIVPVFMLGLYLFWLIMLFGAQVAHAYQNRRNYVMEIEARTISQHGRELAGFRLMAMVGACFQQAKPPPLLTTITDCLQVPSHLIQQLAGNFQKSNLIREIEHREDTAFIPARPLHKITATDILASLRNNSGHPDPDLTPDDPNAVLQILKELRQVESEAGRRYSLADMIQTNPPQHHHRPRRRRRRPPHNPPNKQFNSSET